MHIRPFIIGACLFLVALQGYAQFKLNGDAAQLSCRCYRLTKDQNNEAGSVWNKDSIDLTGPIDKTFDVFLGCDDGGADGIAFVLQSISTTVGGGGGGLGYQGVSPSLAVEFDSHENGWDPANDHIAIQKDGTVDHTVGTDNLAGPVDMDPGGANTEDCAYHTVRITWDPASNSFEVYFDGDLRISYTGDIINNVFGGDPHVFWGFTGATGGKDNDQRFCISVISNFNIGNAPACTSDSVSFVDSSYSTVGRITDWQWDFGDGTSSTDSMPDHKYGSAGTYNVELIATSSNTCKDTVSKTVQVFDGPVADFSADTVCFGDSVQFTDQSTPGGSSIVAHGWFFGDGTTSTQTNPEHEYSSSGTRNMGLIVQDANGCEDTATGLLYQPPELTVSVSDTTHITCHDSADGAAIASANGGTPSYSYSWNTSPAQGDSIASDLDTGTYVVEVADQEGCFATDTVSITQPPELLIDSIVIDSVDCHGACDGKVSVFPSGGSVSSSYYYDWAGGIGDTDEAKADSICPGAYALTIEDDNGCSVDTTFSLFQPDPYYVGTSSDSAHCGQTDGSGIIDSVSGNTAPYSYHWDASAGNQTGDTASGLSAGSYAVLISDSKGCDTSVSVSVPNEPGPGISIDTVIDASCAGGSDGSVTAKANGGTLPYSYQWNDPSAQSGSSATGLSAGMYQVVVTDSAGCKDSLQVSVSEPASVQIFPSSDTTICIGGTATLTAEGSGGTPGYTYHWDQGLGTGKTHSVSPGSDKVYTVYAEDTNGCTSATETVRVELYPPLQVSTSPDAAICPGKTAQLTATASGGKGSGYSYSWSNGGSGNSVVVSPGSTKEYAVTLQDGCESPAVADTVKVTVNALPNVKIQGQDLEGCRPVQATLVNATDPSMVGDDCQWDLGTGERIQGCGSIAPSFEEAGCHDVQLTVESPDGCVDSTTRSDFVCVRPYPDADFRPEPKKATVQDPEVRFTNLSTGASKYRWDLGGLATSQELHPVYSFPSKGGATYEVCLRTENSYGCRDSICKAVEVEGKFLIYVPNAFTPDGDGVNDRFGPVVQGADASEYRFVIYDQWGQKVFETKDPSKKWDGSVNGSQASQKTDVYVWRIVTKKEGTGESVEKKGHVTLIR